MNHEVLKAFSLISQIGINMLVPIFICILVGKFIDEKLGANNIILIIFVILGVLSSFRNLYVIAKQHIKESDKKE